jgi:hypothetical protein
MEGIEKPHPDTYKEITNDWTYGESCMLISLLIWDLQNFKRLVFVVQSVHANVWIPSPIMHWCRERMKHGETGHVNGNSYGAC